MSTEVAKRREVTSEFGGSGSGKCDIGSLLIQHMEGVRKRDAKANAVYCREPKHKWRRD